MNPIAEINEATALEYFSRLDALVKPGTELYVIGGSAIALLGAKIRTTADVDVALPYSKLEVTSFGEASAKAGLPVNPSFGYQGAYIELVQALMLTLPKPKSEESLQVLFRGTNLTVKTGSGADLVASKLYRYSEQDQEDIQFLMLRGGVKLDAVRESVSRLPERFRDDVMTAENLENLERDLAMWREGTMTARERLQLAYEIAFLPRRLNGLFRGWLKDPAAVPADELKALDEAAMLHLPLPQGGYASVRALYRLAAYQAGSCDYGMRGFIDNVRRRLNRPALSETAVPSGMVKDVVLPKYRVPES